MAQQMAGMMNPQTGSAQQPNTTQGSIPPPIPQVTSYFYGVNGQQIGPVNFNQLRILFANRTINKDTFIWKQGMVNWIPLKEIEELKSFLGGATPPPLPTL